MGIINVTPDSFYAGSRTFDRAAIGERARMLMRQGADMLDVGAYSSRPGAGDISVQEEIDRLGRGMEVLHSVGCQLPVSVDTFRAEVARVAVEQMGCDIINDISGGNLDEDMFATVARLQVPYVLMHMRGTPRTMQTLTDYPGDVTVGVISELAQKVAVLNSLGASDIIIDPGFGFAKTPEQNYRLANGIPLMENLFKRPVLVGISRKSMLTRLLNISSDEALNATTALHACLLDRGAAILRVHDVWAARQAVDIYRALTAASGDTTSI